MTDSLNNITMALNAGLSSEDVISAMFSTPHAATVASDVKPVSSSAAAAGLYSMLMACTIAVVGVQKHSPNLAVVTFSRGHLYAIPVSF